MLNWIVKRVFNEDNVGYILKIVQPKLKEAVLDMLHDEEFHKETLIPIMDGYYDRYRQKVFGTIGGLQKGLNSEVNKAIPQFDVFGKDGRLSAKKILPMIFSGGIQGLLGGNQAQTNRRTGKGSQNAPKM